MKNSKIKSLISKTSNYLFGVGDDQFYKNTIYISENHFPEGIEKENYTKRIKFNRFTNITAKIGISMLELGLISAAVIKQEPNFLYGFMITEPARFLLQKINNTDKRSIIKLDKKIMETFPEILN